ncbi:DUF1768 domain-containing protein [Agrobacterium tumefaciens]|nr:DUF1768 domain-containing protein [Agrobacterium tumefaciens]NTE22979.1 DUF1768 domain-containing protein [Agrobacterium tumefaciens]
MKSKVVHSALFGLAIGDALGVPVEFQSRTYLAEHQVKEMEGFGTHNQPSGTWSDDSSLTFCLAESLCSGYDLQDMSRKFLQWYRAEVWTPHGEVFDIGIATATAMRAISNGTDPVLCGGKAEKDNGNGSLMRILPLVFHLHKEQNLQVIYNKVKEVSSITHAHFRSIFACFIYIVYALEVIKCGDKFQSYSRMQSILSDFINKNEFDQAELKHFDRILSGNISNLSVDEVFSSGYVVHSLEASLWCVLNSDTYEDTVLKAVNLGEDTDTTAAIAGGLAGLIYGFDAIPEKWKNLLVRRSDIEELCTLLENKYNQSPTYMVEKLFSSQKKLEYFFFWEHQVPEGGILTKSCLTQWWDAPFIVDQVKYRTAEHWMMSKKAKLFNDQETLEKILLSKSPEEVKNLGRQVKNYDEAVWLEYRYQIVKEGNFHKFSQNQELREFLIHTEEKVLVEASPVDLIWGIGLAEDHKNATIPEKWKGLNLLGFALMEVRDEMKLNDL